MQTCSGILVRSGSDATEKTIVRVTRTVDKHPIRFSHDSFRKLGTKRTGSSARKLTKTANRKGLIPLISAAKKGFAFSVVVWMVA